MDPKLEDLSWDVRDLEDKAELLLAQAKHLLQQDEELLPVAIIFTPNGETNIIPLPMEMREYINPVLKMLVKKTDATAIFTIADTYAAQVKMDFKLPEGKRVKDLPERFEGILVQGTSRNKLYCSKFQTYTREGKDFVFSESPTTLFEAPEWDILLQNVFNEGEDLTIH